MSDQERKQNGKGSYRRGVGMVVLNKEGNVFVGRRIDFPEGAWQFPQGGIREGEPLQDAVLRELYEETGMKTVQILEEAETWSFYDFPPDLIAKMWDQKFRGQTQKWFLIQFLGQESEIDLKRHKPEFSAWQWMNLKDVVDQSVAFKRDVYTHLFHLWGGKIKEKSL